MGDSGTGPANEVRTVELTTNSSLVFTADVAGPADAPLVVLLHGFPQSRYAWRHQLPALAGAGMRALAPDQRGYSPGARPQDRAAYATDRLVGDVLDLADVAGADRFHLVGHDWGGQIAWLTAIQHPERVLSLSVLSRPHPAAFASGLRSDPAQRQRSKHHTAFGDPTTVSRLLEDDARRLRRLYANAQVPEADAGAYLDLLADPAALEAAVEWYRAAATQGGLALADVGPCTVPTLYLWGSRDESVGRVAAEATAAHVEAPYTFVELPDLGHFLTDETVDGVNAPLLAHLSDHGAGVA